MADIRDFAYGSHGCDADAAPHHEVGDLYPLVRSEAGFGRPLGAWIAVDVTVLFLFVSQQPALCSAIQAGPSNIDYAKTAAQSVVALPSSVYW
ncbi:hypothetical protein ACVIGB_006832 [Bradyrhizobium sp. USDA 4341]